MIQLTTSPPSPCNGFIALILLTILAAFAAGGSAADVSMAASVASSAVENNRRLHDGELWVLRTVQHGKSPEEQQRLKDAAMAMIKANKGVEPSDPRYREIMAAIERGKGYVKEQQMLKASAIADGRGYLFEYTWADSVVDASERSGLTPKIIGAAKTVASVASFDVGGFVEGYSQFTNIPFSAGLAVARGSSALAKPEIIQKLINGHNLPEEGTMVLRSFEASTPSRAVEVGLRIGEEAAYTAAYGAAGAVAGKGVAVAAKTPVGQSITHGAEQVGSKLYNSKLAQSVLSSKLGQSMGARPVAASAAAPSVVPAGALKSGVGIASPPVGKIIWVEENAGMSNRARSYNDSATGARSNSVTKKGQAPALQYIAHDKVSKVVKFDGVENGILIDRKLAVVTTEKSKQQAIRQSLALEQNGLKGVWEVPDYSQALRAEKMFKGLNIKNIEVRIINEPSAR